MCRGRVLEPYDGAALANGAAPPLRDVLRALDSAHVRIDVDDPHVTLDLDRPEDVARVTGGAPALLADLALTRSERVGIVVVWFVYMARCTATGASTPASRATSRRVSRNTTQEKGRANTCAAAGPLALCAETACRSQGNALRVELAVKALPRAAKEALVADASCGAFPFRAPRGRRSNPKARAARVAGLVRPHLRPVARARPRSRRDGFTISRDSWRCHAHGPPR